MVPRNGDGGTHSGSRSGPGTNPSGVHVEVNDAWGSFPGASKRLPEVVEWVLRAEGVERAVISIALVDDATIRRINRRHLGHDWPTDVLSFPLSQPGEAELAGELVISTERVRAKAEEFALDPWTELILYVIHGLLHLRGYDDHRESDAARMKQREVALLSALGLPDPYSANPRSRTGGPRGEDAGCRG
jgi:probable rRNA maturation factor